jgi:putative transposase
MSNTYTQIHIQFVFAVKGRRNLIDENHRIVLEKYICGIITNLKCKPVSIYCNPDHTHILIGINPTVSISDLARIVKTNSSKFINDRNWLAGKFSWQDGYGAFSYSKSQINAVAKYILNQPEHHKKKSFKEEYISILKKCNIDFDTRYLFIWNEE